MERDPGSRDLSASVAGDFTENFLRRGRASARKETFPVTNDMGERFLPSAARMPEQMPTLEIKELYKSFSGRCILQNVSVTAFPGEILGFLGPNGSGKDYHHQAHARAAQAGCRQHPDMRVRRGKGI